VRACETSVDGAFWPFGPLGIRAKFLLAGKQFCEWATWAKKTMYKHASYRRTARGDPDEQEDDQFRRRILAAAGVEPRVRGLLFRFRIKKALRGLWNKDPNYAALAHELNGAGLPDANGNPWTHQSLRAFVDYYLRGIWPQLD
jgi:hypothetical protein